MGRMFGKTRSRFHAWQRGKKKANSRPPLTWPDSSLAYCCCCRERHVDGFDVRWIYNYDYDRFGCRHTLLSIVSPQTVTYFLTPFLSYVSFSSLSFRSLSSLSPVSSFSSFLSLCLSFFFFPRFHFRSRPLRCCMYVYMCLLFFFLLFLARSEALVIWLQSNKSRASRAAFGVTWSEMYGANRGVCYPFPRATTKSAVPRNVS